ENLASNYADYLDKICNPNRIEDFDCDKFTQGFYNLLKEKGIPSFIYWTQIDNEGFMSFVNVVPTAKNQFRIYDFTQQNPLVATLNGTQITNFLHYKYGGIWKPRQGIY
ncbi:MAG: hypothetical protein QXR96_02580, partial [Candidatus Woesearchaeota archaeon]